MPLAATVDGSDSGMHVPANEPIYSAQSLARSSTAAAANARMHEQPSSEGEAFARTPAPALRPDEAASASAAIYEELHGSSNANGVTAGDTPASAYSESSLQRRPTATAGPAETSASLPADGSQQVPGRAAPGTRRSDPFAMAERRPSARLSTMTSPDGQHLRASLTSLSSQHSTRSISSVLAAQASGSSRRGQQQPPPCAPISGAAAGGPRPAHALRPAGSSSSIFDIHLGSANPARTSSHVSSA